LADFPFFDRFLKVRTARRRELHPPAIRRPGGAGPGPDLLVFATVSAIPRNRHQRPAVKKMLKNGTPKSEFVRAGCSGLAVPRTPLGDPFFENERFAYTRRRSPGISSVSRERCAKRRTRPFTTKCTTEPGGGRKEREPYARRAFGNLIQHEPESQ